MGLQIWNNIFCLVLYWYSCGKSVLNLHIFILFYQVYKSMSTPWQYVCLLLSFFPNRWLFVWGYENQRFFSPSGPFGIVASKCDLTWNFVVGCWLDIVGELDRKLANFSWWLPQLDWVVEKVVRPQKRRTYSYNQQHKRHWWRNI